MNGWIKIKRPWIWLWRIRHRCGYGVHSPFAFDFITHVIYEKGAYYKYAELELLEKEEAAAKGRRWAYRESRKVKRLLFRLVNRVQPHSVLDVGAQTVAACYMKEAKQVMEYRWMANASALDGQQHLEVDLLYLHDYQRPDEMERAFYACVDHVSESSVMVMEGIGYSKPMADLWKKCKDDCRTGIAFDLYDLGILFFDRSKIKQDYVVNF